MKQAKQNPSLQGRDVVVTGGSGGLGRVVVGALLEAGAKVHVPVWNGAELEGLDWDAVRTAIGVDLRDPDQVQSFYREIPDLWATVNLAGGFAMAPFSQTSLADLGGLWEMNTVTAFNCTQAAVQSFLRRALPQGRVVNVSARPALQPTGGMVAYTMSKAAVAAMTVSLAEELAQTQIRINAVAPSVIDTPGNRAAMPDADPSAWVSPQELARLVEQLIDPGNSGLRGAVLPAYGRC